MVLGISAAASAESVTLPAEGKTWVSYEWTGDGNSRQATVEGYSFNLVKGTSSTDLVAPDEYSIRIYAGAQLTVTAPAGETFDKVVITADRNSKASAVSAEGWTVSELVNNTCTMTSATPQSSITFDGAGKQLRLGSMVISSGEGDVEPDPTPDPTPDPVENGYVVDFTTDAAHEALPSSEPEEVTTATVDGVEFTFLNCKGGSYNGYYLQISGKNYTEAYLQFELPVDSKAIILHTGANASVNVTVTLSSNGEDIESDFKLDAKDADFTFNLPAAYQAKGTVLRLATTNSFNAQITKLIFSENAGEEPTPTPSVEPAGEGTVASPYNVAKALEVTKALEADVTTDYEVYVKGIITNVKELSTYYGNATYEIADVEGGETFTIFRGKWFDGEEFTSEDQLAVGAEVVVVGSLVNYKGNTPEMAQGNAVYSYNGQTSSTGIAEIAAEEASVEYFNLQGVRISEPAAGQVVIRRQGNKVSKIFVK